jgi:hypothetical protein
MKTKASKGDKAKADKIFSLAIRSIGYCEACKRRENLQCAHIMSRRYSKVRCDTRNAFCLCAGCHIYYTQNPYEFARFIDTTWARKYVDDVRAIGHSVTAPKTDWLERVEFLKPIVEGHLSLIEARGMER